MLSAGELLYEKLLSQSHNFHQVVDFDSSKEKIIKLDFTKNNTELLNADISDVTSFSSYIDKKLRASKAKFGIGGYNEERILYNKYDLFKNNLQQRTVHLGVDIWGEAGTKVYAPLGGMVHSFAYNKNDGDYGATIILMHQLDTVIFYTLYGHLSLEDIAKVSEFEYIIRGHVIGHFGQPAENGKWPPHLHFQVIKDIRMNKGDYPGVCSIEERKKYLANCPDPDAIIGMMQYAD